MHIGGEQTLKNMVPKKEKQYIIQFIIKLVFIVMSNKRIKKYDKNECKYMIFMSIKTTVL